MNGLLGKDRNVWRGKSREDCDPNGEKTQFPQASITGPATKKSQDVAVVSILRAIQDEPFWQIPSGLSMSKLLNPTQFRYF
jgi:hypothetical protein